MTDDTDGIYLGRTEQNNIRLTAQKDGEQIVFVVEPDTAETLVAELQREVARAR